MLRTNRKYSYKERQRLPDSAFLLPKYRKLPFKQVQGGRLKISLTHVRNALARADQVQGVPVREVEAAVARAHMILDSRRPMPLSRPVSKRLAANTAGLTHAQARQLETFLLAQGVAAEDMEEVPLSPKDRSKVCVLYWTGLDWDEVWSVKDMGDVMRRRKNLRPNFFGSKRAPADPAAEERRLMRSSREWRDFRNAIRSDYLMRGATLPSAEALDERADARFREYHAERRMRAARGIERNPGRRSLRRNGEFKDEIIEGLVEGLWLPNWADAMEEAGEDLPRNITLDTADPPPDEVEDFAKKLYTATTKANGFSLSTFFSETEDTSDPQRFGYYIAMEAQGHGVSWFDDHEGAPGRPLKLPYVEGFVGFDGGEMIVTFSLSERLHHRAWKG